MGNGKLAPRLWNFWGRLKELTITQAAHLICNQVPPVEPSTCDQEVFEIANRLYEYTSEYQSTRPTGVDVYVPSEIFIHWCKDVGFEPAAWSPERRPKEPKEGESTSNHEAGTVTDREEPSVLGMLAGVIEAKYGEGTVADLKAIKSDKFGQVYADISEWTGLTETTVRKYLKRLPPKK